MPSILPPARPTQDDDPLDFLVYPFESKFWHRPVVRVLEPKLVYYGPLPQSSTLTRQIVGANASPGYVYVIQDDEGEALYVGKTVNPVGRLTNHRAQKPWWPRTGCLTLLGVWAPNREDADAFSLTLEAIAIGDLGPRYNIAGVPR